MSTVLAASSVVLRSCAGRYLHRNLFCVFAARPHGKSIHLSQTTRDSSSYKQRRRMLLQLQGRSNVENGEKFWAIQFLIPVGALVGLITHSALSKRRLQASGMHKKFEDIL